MTSLSTTHDLKTWPCYWAALESGAKRHETRRNDRHFLVGDTLLLREWVPQTQAYSGRTMTRVITYVAIGCAGIDPDYCVLSISDRPLLQHLVSERDAFRKHLSNVLLRGRGTMRADVDDEALAYLKDHP